MPDGPVHKGKVFGGDARAYSTLARGRKLTLCGRTSLGTTEDTSMPEAGPPQETQRNAAPTPHTSRKRSMFDDPIVRRMGYIAFGLVVLFLVAVLSVVFSGVTGGSTGPRTLSEKEVAVAGAAVANGSADAQLWGSYIASLIANGDYGRARRAINDGRKSVDDSATAEFTVAEVRLLRAQEKPDEALAAADKALKQMDAAHKKALAGAGDAAKSARASGLPENYYDVILIKAYVFRDLKKWDQAIEQFDLYIKQNAGAADVLVDRGNVHIEAGDKAAAEKDFRAALKFIPDSEEAIAGLDKIGAKQ